VRIVNKRVSLFLSLALIALLMVPLVAFGAEKKGFEIVSDNNVGIGGVAVGTSAIVQTVTLQDKDADNDPVTITKIEVNGADGTAIDTDFDSVEVLDGNDNVIFSATPTGGTKNWTVSKTGLSIVVPDDGTYTLKVNVKVDSDTTNKGSRIRPTVVVTMSEGGTASIVRSATDGTDEYITFTREDKGLEVISDDNVNAGKVAPGSSVIVQTITLKDHDPDSDNVKVTQVTIAAEGNDPIVNGDINSIEILDQNDSVVGSNNTGTYLGPTDIALSDFTVPDDGQNTLKVRLTLASGATVGHLIRFTTVVRVTEGTSSDIDVTVTDGTGEYVGYKTQDTGLEQTIDQNVNAGVLTSGQTAVVQKVKLVDNDNDTDPVDIDTVTVDFGNCAGSLLADADIQSVKILDGAGSVVGIGTVQTQSATIDIVGYQIPDDGSDMMQVQVTLPSPLNSGSSGKVICPVVTIQTSEGGSTNTTKASDGTQEVISGAGTNLGLEVVDDQNVSANPIPGTLTVVQRVTLKDQDRASTDHDPVTITKIELTNAYPGTGATDATLTSGGDLVSAQLYLDGDTTATYDISTGSVDLSGSPYQINDGHTATVTLKLKFNSDAVGKLFQPQLAITHTEGTASGTVKLAVSGTVMQVGMGNNDRGLEVVSDNNVAKGDVMPGATSRTRVMTVKLVDNDNDSHDVTVTGIKVEAGAKLDTVYLLDKNGATKASAVEGSTEIPTDSPTATFISLTWTIPDDTTNELRVEIIYKATATSGTLARPTVTLTVQEPSGGSDITETATDGSPETIGLSLADMGPETVSDHNVGTFIAPGSAAVVMQIDLADSDGDADTHDVTVTKVELNKVDSVTNVTSSDITKVELLNASGSVIALVPWSTGTMSLSVPGGLKVSDDTSTYLKVRVTTSASAVVGRTFAFKAVVTYTTEGGSGDLTKTVYEGTLNEIGTAPVEKTLQSIGALPATVPLALSGTQQLAITATYDNSTTADVTSTSTYASNKPTVATVSSSGLITGIGTGSATVTVSYTEAGVTKTTTVPVTVGGTSVCCTLVAGYNLISLPVQPTNNAPKTVFTDDPLYLCTYNTATGEFEWVDKPASATSGTVGALTSVSALGGYWLAVQQAGQFCVTGTALTGDQVVDLATLGWHMIGVPYDTAWGNATGAAVKFTRNGVDKWLTDAVAAGWVYGTVFSWNPTISKWDKITVAQGTTLVPCLGYWIKTRVSGLTMTFTETAWDPGNPPSFSAMSLKSEDPGNPPMPVHVTPLTFDSSKLAFGNYPNPVTDVHTTHFTVMGAMAAFVDAIKVDIYDLSGKKVYSSGEIVGTSVDWHTDNDYGEYLANGVYLYKMYAQVEGQWAVSKVKTIAILR